QRHGPHTPRRPGPRTPPDAQPPGPDRTHHDPPTRRHRSRNHLPAPSPARPRTHRGNRHLLRLVHQLDPVGPTRQRHRPPALLRHRRPPNRPHPRRTLTQPLEHHHRPRTC